MSMGAREAKHALCVNRFHVVDYVGGMVDDVSNVVVDVSSGCMMIVSGFSPVKALYLDMVWLRKILDNYIKDHATFIQKPKCLTIGRGCLVKFHNTVVTV